MTLPGFVSEEDQLEPRERIQRSRLPSEGGAGLTGREAAGSRARHTRKTGRAKDSSGRDIESAARRVRTKGK